MQLFETRTKPTAGGAYRRVHIARCSRCPWVDEVTDSVSGQRMPPDAIAQKFRQRGWSIGGRRSSDTCPKCAGARARNLTPAQRRAAHLKIAGVAKAVLGPEFQPEIPGGIVIMAAAAEPPRKPTREDNARIAETIEKHWSYEQQCYLASFSDQAVADQLKVPRAWVSALRDLMFGPEDTNEAAAAAQAKLPELEARAKALEDRAMQLAQDAEALGRELAAYRAAAGQRRAS